MPLPSPPLEPMATASSPAARRVAAGKQAREICNWAHPLPIGSGGSAGAVAGERRRRHRGSTAAEARSPVRGKVWLSNTRRTELQCDLEEMLRGPIGLESRRGRGLGKACPAAAAGARIPASWRFGFRNKRKGELLGTLVELRAARVCEER
jgi:hypothetical protein